MVTLFQQFSSILLFQAVEEKEKGNAAYKKKDFETAHQHYDKAIELDPTNIVYYTNKSAVFFEQKRYDECIDICNKGIEIGRDNRADFSLIAKYVLLLICLQFLNLEPLPFENK